MSLLPTTHNILSYILVLRLTPYVDETIGDHPSTYRLTNNETLCICQILEKKWEYNGPVQQLFVDFEKAYDSVRKGMLYHILTEFRIHMKFVRLINVFKQNLY
jgi:hypothetical protein